ncbi:peptidase T [Saccharibacillus sp. CPCC 101409]|uniref:peptidase T n=1 Tax=Saccharibacillus sp. CPCC 101409 TaxID=3058041 RepID=UPI002673E960|nr:peptidase T [Saccharibacillus sp. CPCC 101409]MDO3410039.1 peptidase T [Saccharibacillus sp. CPCC 101409]
MKKELIERLDRYARFDTQSNDESETCPSTPGQMLLAEQLVRELTELGLTEITLDENAYVMATLPANTDKENVPVIGFLAHLDTATELTGANVNPQVIDSYDGGDIVLNTELNIVLSPREFPELTHYVGHTLVTTDGTTLLGADDKAGMAEIMTALNYLIAHPELKHGKIRVAFTPDEEIGRGPQRFDVEKFGAKYAYTMDGGPLGELEYESFNAAAAKVTINGVSVHPGTAKGKMINAAKIAMEFHRRLPEQESPEFTDGYDGFFHLIQMGGGTDRATLSYIVRDFDRESFERRKNMLENIVAEFRQTYGEENVILELRDQYYNMREKIEPVIEIVDIAREAMEGLGIKPDIRPIRGGTDGSQLSYMGLPTPNIFTGGENYHGRYEYVSADNMVKATEVILAVVQSFERKA